MWYYNIFSAISRFSHLSFFARMSNFDIVTEYMHSPYIYLPICVIPFKCMRIKSTIIQIDFSLFIYNSIQLFSYLLNKTLKQTPSLFSFSCFSFRLLNSIYTLTYPFSPSDIKCLSFYISEQTIFFVGVISLHNIFSLRLCTFKSLFKFSIGH